MASKKDRDAYERGQKERRAQQNPVSYLTNRSEREGDTASEKAAFKKGLKGEQFDADKDDGGCFLTTACVQHAGLHNDCWELDMMRRLRNEYVRNLPGGAELLKDYYRAAPNIVMRIRSLPQANRAFDRLLRRIRAVAALVANGSLEEAFAVAWAHFEDLKLRYFADGDSSSTQGNV